MANSSIAINEPGTVTKRADTEQLVVDTVTVERERVQVAGVLAAEIARVLNANPAGSEYALLVRTLQGYSAAVPMFTDPIDRALRDLGKVDIAAFDVSLPAGSANIGDVDVLTLPTIGQLPAALVGGRLDINLGAITGGVLFDVSDRAARLVGQVEGRAAHDVALAGNPQRIGGRASAGQLTAVVDGRTVDLVADRHGNLHVRAGVEAPAGAITTHVHFPAVNTRATITKAAGAAGVRHVCTGLTVVLAANGTAPAAVQLNVRLRDGIADTGTILWQAVITLPATAGVMNGISRSGLWIPGTAATAMTLEFSAAGGANTFESVSMEIVDITE